MSKARNVIMEIQEGFEVSSARYNSEENFKADEMMHLAKLLGVKITRKPSYGYATGTLNGEEVDFQADRDGSVIVVTAMNEYSKRVRVKKLSDTQIKNLKKKLVRIIDDRKEGQNRNAILMGISSSLRKKGIEVDRYNKSITVDGNSFYFSDGKVKSGKSISHKDYISFKVNDGEKGIQKELDRLKKELLSQLNNYKKAAERVKSSRSDIEKYFELSDKK